MNDEWEQSESSESIMNDKRGMRSSLGTSEFGLVSNESRSRQGSKL